LLLNRKMALPHHSSMEKEVTVVALKH